jgi:RNA polymerase sigma-70 factor (ECF subfamily)
VRQLSPDQADAVLLRIVADMDVGQVAEVMGRSEGAVRVLVHRGLHRLRDLLSRAMWMVV